MLIREERRVRENGAEPLSRRIKHVLDVFGDECSVGCSGGLDEQKAGSGGRYVPEGRSVI